MTGQHALFTGHWLVAGAAFGVALLGLAVEPQAVVAVANAPQALGSNGVASGNPNGAGGNTKDNGNDKKDFTIAGNVTGLYPGAVRPLVLTLTNPNNFPIQVASFAATVAGVTGCAASNVRVDALAPGVVIPANGSTTATVQVRMADSPPNACQHATFGLTYSGTAVKP